MSEKDNFVNIYEIGNSVIKMIKEKLVIKNITAIVKSFDNPAEPKFIPEDGCLCTEDCHVQNGALWEWSFCFCECKKHGADITPYTKKEVADSTIALLKQMGL